MDTGVLSLILHGFPYPSHWTRVCSTIMFVMDVVIFLILGTVYLTRWIIFRKYTYYHTRRDSEEIALQACPCIQWLTITVQVQLTCGESWGYGFTILAYVMWWIGLLWVITICVLREFHSFFISSCKHKIGSDIVAVYIHLIKNPSRAIVDKWLPTAVFIPIVGIFTAANAGGAIVVNAVNDTHM
jgi:tellurite resistance protein TehA-like permease